MEYQTQILIRVETDDSEEADDFLQALQTLCRLMTNDSRTVEIKSVEEN
jgi:hypothetical protein